MVRRIWAYRNGPYELDFDFLGIRLQAVTLLTRMSMDVGAKLNDDESKA